jgi:hypothetical protein
MFVRTRRKGFTNVSFSGFLKIDRYKQNQPARRAQFEVPNANTYPQRQMSLASTGQVERMALQIKKIRPLGNWTVPREVTISQPVEAGLSLVRGY